MVAAVGGAVVEARAGKAVWDSVGRTGVVERVRCAEGGREEIVGAAVVAEEEEAE